MYGTEAEFVTRFWDATPLDADWEEEGWKRIVASVENSSDEFFSIYWESEGKKYILDIPYSRFCLAANEAGTNILEGLKDVE